MKRRRGKKGPTAKQQIDAKRRQRIAAKKKPPKERIKVPEGMSVRQYVRTCTEFKDIERKVNQLQSELGQTQRAQIAAEGRCEGIALMIAEACDIEAPEKKALVFDGAEFKVIEGEEPTVHMGLDKKVFRKWEAAEEAAAKEKKEKPEPESDEWVVDDESKGQDGVPGSDDAGEVEEVEEADAGKEKESA